MSAAVPGSSAVAALTRLDGYMASTGYDTDHPWRSEIAEMLTMPVLIQHDADTRCAAAVTASRCPIDLAASAVDAVDLGIFITEEIASMVSGIHDRADRTIDGLTLEQLKRRMAALNRLILTTVQFADGRSDMLREIHSDLHRSLDALNTPASECWVLAAPGSMPPDDVVVIGWDSTTGKPCAVFFDFNPGVHSWISQFDPTTIYEGEITHWRYCNAPADADSEGVTS